MARYRRRSKKTTPLKELIFALILLAVFTLAFQPNLLPTNLSPVIGAALLVVLAAGGALYLLLSRLQRAKQKALRAVELSHVDEMPGVVFERYVAALLQSQGYRTTMTPPSSDFGVDIIAAKDGVRTAVQVKRYRSKLDQTAIREAIAGMSVRKYNCTKAMVVTNSTFTNAAKFLANESGCKLIDREILGEWIVAFQRQ